jgi:hypothetical protein
VTGASTGVTMNGSYSTATPGTGAGSGAAAGGTGSQLTNMGVPGSPATSGLFNSSRKAHNFISTLLSLFPVYYITLRCNR